MFFVASKLFWIFFSPVSVLLIAALIGAWQSKGRFPRTGRTIALAAILILKDCFHVVEHFLPLLRSKFRILFHRFLHLRLG